MKKTTKWLFSWWRWREKENLIVRTMILVWSTSLQFLTKRSLPYLWVNPKLIGHSLDHENEIMNSLHIWFSKEDDHEFLLHFNLLFSQAFEETMKLSSYLKITIISSSSNIIDENKNKNKQLSFTLVPLGNILGF